MALSIVDVGSRHCVAVVLNDVGPHQNPGNLTAAQILQRLEERWFQYYAKT